MATLNLKVRRIAKRADYTIGKLYVDGQYFCDTLEDKDRGLHSGMTEAEIAKIKVYAKTAIPTGSYKVIVNRSPKLKRLLPRLLDVKGYVGILMHKGTRHTHSAGCILVGENKVVGGLVNSELWEVKLVNLLLNHKGDIKITVE